MGYDARALEELGGKFWTGWGLAVTLGLFVAYLGATRLAPTETFTVGLLGALAVLFAGFALVSERVGERADAVGQAVATVGWVAQAASLANYGGRAVFYGGLALVLVGGGLTLAASHSDRVRAVFE